MIIKLYYNSSADNVVNKDITEVAELSGDLRESVDLLTPELTIENNNNILTSQTVNYLYIPEFNRYYFIRDIKFESGKLFVVKCDVDVLYTYRDEIKQQKAVIARQENKANLNIQDGNLIVENYPYVQTINFPTGFNPSNYEYVLICSGNNVEISTTPPNS